MKHFVISSLVALSLTLAGCAQNTGQSEGQKTELLKAGDFKQKLAELKDAQLVDVRTPDEYAGGHIDNALNINFFDDDFEAQISKLDKSKPVMVYCAAGGRSGEAAEKFSEMGFNHVIDLDGGMGAWNTSKYPVEK